MWNRRGLRTVLAVVLTAASGMLACTDTSPTETEPNVEPFEVPALDSVLAELAMDDALAAISEADLAAHIGALAHDSMKGRRTGRPELEAAAAYVAGELGDLGVEPAGAEGYLTRWDYAGGYSTGWSDSLATWPPNVVALIPGSDPELADAYVVVTAHYDHVGTTLPEGDTDSIYNGADDNASGTAVLLEVADALAALPTAPRRSVLFVAVSGEELGLLGSEAFVRDPAVAVSRMVANINLDMVSRGVPDTVYTVGYGLSTVGLLSGGVAEQFPALGVIVLSDDMLGSDLIARSDHFNFARNGVPAVGIFGGFHPDYHTPDDEADRVDVSKAAQVARLATYLVATVAMMDEPPAWTVFGAQYMQRYW